MDICVVGAGHVGLVTAACFADLGHSVVCVDNDQSRIQMIKRGKMPFYEPGLDKLVAKNLKKKLSFTTSLPQGVKKSEMIFIAVGTPPLPNGEADLTAVESVVRTIAETADDYRLIIEKSTVPVETGKRIQETVQLSARKGVVIDVASNPEFLKEGTAVDDFFNPDRIVFGADSPRAKKLLRTLYKPFKVPLVVTNIASSELIKHASNAFLSTKISFINAVSVICDKVGADVNEVALGMGMDPRIGKSFLNAGAGYGGFCFPKDLEAFITIAQKLGYNFKLLKAVKEINDYQKQVVLEKLESQLWNLKGKRIAVLGLSFKPNTDDTRFAPALDIIEALLDSGAKVSTYDPEAIPEAKHALGTRVTYAKDGYAAVKQADAMILMTEWDVFAQLDMEKVYDLMKHPILIDGRNLYDPKKMQEIGFRYLGIGRS